MRTVGARSMYYMVAGLLAFLLFAASGDSRDGGPRVVSLRIAGPISPASAEFILDGLEMAREQDAAALLIEIDTEGGLLSSTRTIVQALLAAEVPVITYVAPSGAGAASAGVFVVMAANVAAMAPGTNIGASTPVQGDGGDIAGAMGEKIKSFTASFAKAIAEQRGRNVEWAEQAVRDAISGTDRDALEAGVIDVVAPSKADLLELLDGRKVMVGDREVVLALAGATVVPLEMTFRQRVLDFLSNPNVAYLLLLGGLLGLYLELSHPGTWVPGLTGALCLAISLASFQVLPIDTTGLLLLLGGVVLLVAEIFIPSFGIVGIIGFIAFVLGSLFLFDRTEPGVHVDRSLIAAASSAVGGVMLVIATLVVRGQRGRPTTGREGLVGQVGEVRSRIAPQGTIFVEGELWKARSSEVIEVGEGARIVSVEGLILHVTQGAKGESNPR